MTNIEDQGPMPAVVADMVNRHGFDWLRNAAGLLRAAKVLARAQLADIAALSAAKAAGTPTMGRPPLGRQVAFLAALAVEDALKAVIADGLPLPTSPSGVLPKELFLRGHDVKDLATRAGIVGADDDERDVLDRGQDFIERVGRYTTTKDVINKHVPTWNPIDAVKIVAAAERLVLRAARKDAALSHTKPQFAPEDLTVHTDRWVAYIEYLASL